MEWYGAKLLTGDTGGGKGHAHPFWKEAQQDHKIELRLGPAPETLHQLINDGMSHQYEPSELITASLIFGLISSRST